MWSPGQLLSRGRCTGIYYQHIWITALGFKSMMLKAEQEVHKVNQSTFVSQPNPVTGKMDWVLKDESYDFVQEIARSGYGDMLHDKDRNVKYFEAIQAAVSFLKSQGRKVNVLDIGTGTGLLSMMAVKSGADTVTACEAFEPMAECAKEVIKANGMADKIRLIPKRSTSVILGKDLLKRANLLVTELFDTELIGEGAILSYTDAHNRLMESDSVAVPTLGRVFIQAVQSDVLRSFNSIIPIQLGNGKWLALPNSMKGCGGAPSLHDLQVSELESQLTFLSDPKEVFRFDFSKRNALVKEKHCKLSVTALEDGNVDAFVMWWDLQMDPLGEIWLSCAPCWTRTTVEPYPWRDHWMQAIYYPALSLKVEKDQDFYVFCSHDEYSLWFDTADYKEERPVCRCGLHVTFSRGRLGQMTNNQAIKTYTLALQQHITGKETCLVISEGSLLPLIAASLGAKKVYYLDTNVASRKIMYQILDCNKIMDKVKILDKEPENITSEDLDASQIDIVIAEPFCSAAHLPWEHIYFWYAISALKSHLNPQVTILPHSMTVKSIGLQFRDLHKIRMPVGNCEGFDISQFDKLIQSASENADPELEPQPLWEYPALAMTAPTVIMNQDFSTAVEGMAPLQNIVDLVALRSGSLNGIAFWTEYDFGKDLSISQGLQGDWKGDKVRWDMFSRQAVHLFSQALSVDKGTELKIQCRFLPSTGDLAIRMGGEKVF